MKWISGMEEGCYSVTYIIIFPIFIDPSSNDTEFRSMNNMLIESRILF